MIFYSNPLHSQLLLRRQKILKMLKNGLRKVKIRLNFFSSVVFTQLNPDYLNNILKKNVHSGDLPHKKQLEKKNYWFHEQVVTQSEKISNLFLQEKLPYRSMLCRLISVSLTVGVILLRRLKITKKFFQSCICL